MCSDKKLQLAKDFRKKSFYITTGIMLMITFASIIMAFSDVKLQAKTNDTNIQTNSDRITVIEKNMKGIEEIRFNLKNLCIKQGVEYIEGAGK